MFLLIHHTLILPNRRSITVHHLISSSPINPGLEVSSQSQNTGCPLIIFPVAAEYLAKGYQLSDHILQRAIETDSKFPEFRNRRQSW